MERFWVQIIKIEKEDIIGIIKNNLIENEKYVFGSKIKFKKKHIYDIEWIEWLEL